MKKENGNVTKETAAERVEKRKPFYKKAPFKVGIGVIAGLVVIYFCFAAFFQSHFCFGTMIGSIDAGGKSVEKVKELVKEEIEHYSLELIEREELSEVISGSSISVEPVFNGEIEQMLSEQNEFAWPVVLFQKTALELEKAVAFDEDALFEALAGLKGMQASYQREPVNASCSGYTEAGYVEIPADYGTVINKEKLTAAVSEAVLALEGSLDVDAAGCYEEPEIGDDDAGLLEMIDRLNTYAATKIRYDFGEEEEILDGTIISEWLTTDENMDITVDEDAILTFVKSLASKYNTAYKSKTLKTSYGPEVTISTGPYGWRIDNSGEVEQILEDLQTGEEISREPLYLQRANSHGENDYGDSYVEINLTAQHLFLYKDGKLVTESDIVSGCIAKGNATPTGAYPVTYITRDAVLRGADYATPVSYWMPFNGNIGMHDLTSRKNFGGDIYKTNGSHGCINLPYSAAQTIYENIEAGFPVLVYELPGTQSESVKQKAANAVINAINSIGTVTLESEAIIVYARSLYDTLDTSERELVTNYNTLMNAEAVLAALKAEAEAVITPPDSVLPVEPEVSY